MRTMTTTAQKSLDITRDTYVYLQGPAQIENRASSFSYQQIQFCDSCLPCGHAIDSVLIYPLVEKFLRENQV